MPELVPITGGIFLMGSDEQVYPDDGEGPVREVRVHDFAMAPCAVTNDDFGRFIEATGYTTTAETFGSSFVFGGLLPDDHPDTRAVAAAPWWRLVEGASWRMPEGSRSGLTDRGDHPAVHVSWFDAMAYCEWVGARLPTEAEWEYAARGGLVQRRFPWGDDLEPGGKHMMNVFQGRFPQDNTAADGYRGTAPVDAFAPNGYSLYNMCGNVWEWCADDVSIALGSTGEVGQAKETRRAMRGGSYLCHHSYCWRYRVAARSSNTLDSSAGNIGFRVAWSS